MSLRQTENEHVLKILYNLLINEGVCKMLQPGQRASEKLGV